MRTLRPLCLMLLCLTLLAGAAGVAAHPLDALFHDVRLNLTPQRVQLQIRIVVGPLVAGRLWDEADRNADGMIQPAEAASWGQRYLAQLDLLLNEQALQLAEQPVQVSFPATRSEFVSGSSAEILVRVAAPLPGMTPGDYTLQVAGRAYPDISAYDFKALGSAGLVVRESARLNGTTTSFPLLVRTGLPQPTPAAAMQEGEELAGRIGDSQLLGRLRSGSLSPGFLLASLLLAMLLGALHALQPGHGKTLVAAYLVGSRGTVRHAIALGGIVTFTHTASVLGLGGLLLAFSQTVKPERILPGLTAVSGLLVVAMGAGLLRARLRDAWRGGAAHGQQHHGHGHAHDHDQHHDQQLDHHHDHDHHDHNHGHDGHTHALPERITPRSLVALGVSGGIVPCTEALVILIVAVALGRLLLGLLMIVAFSLGLASILIGIGIALVTLGERLRGRLPSAAGLTRWLPVVSATLVLLLGAALAWQGLGGL